ncbi:MAG: 16S rRNA (cytidine(1402)-2'-O)-methyltransferase [Oligoflexia bacterium]|nr:16S rRNA (cytidine(1402)-2'-O)-methyltransferase [Oligoflexia bacterium]
MSEKKRQDLPPGLWVVATPIGNLADLSPRARAALEQAHAILCEDTRQGAKLLAAAGIGRPMSVLERVDAHASEAVLRARAERLRAGESLALISDAGTPAISDPGSALVALAHEAGVKVTPVPGPSAVPALLSVSGFGEAAFVFRGFFPRKQGEREEELARVSASRVARVFVWFESPNRIGETLELLAARMPAAEVVAAKELTKVHERLFTGRADEVFSAIREELLREGPRGEWCFAAKLPELAENNSSEGDESSDWVKALRCLIDARIPASEAARQVSQHFGASRKMVYEKALRLSGKKN